MEVSRGEEDNCTKTYKERNYRENKGGGDRYNFLLLQPITQATLCQIVEKVG